MSSTRQEQPKVSIIIPCKDVNSSVEECIEHCNKQDYDNYEIILLPDSSTKEMKGIKIILTGSVTPGKKRNIGIKNSSGEMCAFIDSDAYPREDWLKNAIKYFSDFEVAAVGGPGVTPESDSGMQKASGLVLSSFMTGVLSSRYKAGKAKESDDIHSCNFIARKSIFGKLEWDERYWPGEDTLLCLGIKGLGKKMLEAPDVVIYHHRRPLFRKHLLQVSRFGMHRGFFAKRFPETSLRLTYFFPSGLVLFLFFGFVMSIFYSSIRGVFTFIVAIYIISTFIAALLTRNLKLALIVWLGIIATHIVYGVYFLMGLSKRELRR